MKRYDIINRFIEMGNYNSYLEIGLQNGVCFSYVKAKHKVSVDPDMKANNPTFRLTSDDFFKQNKEKFDIIFIDGLHENEQVYRDITNSLECLNDGGVIVCHDMNPEKEVIQIVPKESVEWTGDCWKAFVRLRSERNDLEMFTVNTDYGVGVIKKGVQVPLQIENIDTIGYSDLEKNRVEYLGLISVTEFNEKYK
jgi:hypothetical protein